MNNYKNKKCPSRRQENITDSQYTTNQKERITSYFIIFTSEEK